MACRAASNFWFCWFTTSAWVCAGVDTLGCVRVAAGGWRVTTCRGGGVRRRRRSAGATTRVSGKTLPPVPCGGGVEAAGGVGVALSVCASTGVPDAATKTSDEADSRRLRLRRMDRAWFTEKVPDGDNYMLDCGAKHCDPWDERKLWPVTPARFARGAKPKPRCQEIGGPRD